MNVVPWIVLVVAAPLVPGIASRTKSVITGRRGAPSWQLYADIWKLLRRGAVYSVTTTWVFRVAPIALLATSLAATFLLPLDGRNALFSFPGDVIAFAGLFGLGRFLILLGALDTGSSFEGMGASREAAFASLVEPGLFVSLVALSIATDQLSLTGMLGAPLWDIWTGNASTVILIAASVFVLMLAECARVPVDDPATHLELTMVHEVMILDHSGPDFAFIQYASALKLATFAAIILDLLVPRVTLAPALSALLLLVALAGTGIAVGIVESTMARLRMPKVPLYIAGGGALGFLGLILVLR
jgi:formate hydrogenlyase subunit 4